jgi:tetratricopeptide (TPR) repeat protein
MPGFFVSYNKADRDWAVWIAWELEQAGYTTSVQAWDFMPGSNFVLEMQKAASECERTVAVLSPDYLESVFTQPEWAAAFAGDPAGKSRKLVPVRVRPCEIKGLLKSIVFIDLVGVEEAAARRELLEGVRQGRRPTTPVRFPSERPPRFPAALPDIWNVPHLRNPNFTGRDELLAELHAALTSGRPAAVTQAISGLGGVGKTQLAAEYAYRAAREYSLVWWVRAEDPATALSDYVDLARRLELKTPNDMGIAIVSAVRDWLSHNGGWLLILDNAQDPGSCEGLLPYGTAGHVIITSRNSSWKRLAESIMVKTLPREDAVAFLLKRTGQDQARAASALSEAFGDLPLALEHAAAYIEAAGITIGEYLRLFSRHSTQMLGPVATTWALSFERLERENEVATALLKLFAFLAPEEIPRELARKAAGSDLKLHEAVAALRRYSLIEGNRYGVTVHRLVQAAVRQELGVAAEEGKWADSAIRSLYRLRSLAGTARLLPHVQVAAGHAERLGVATDTTVELLRGAGTFLGDRGEYLSAREVFERALRTAEAAFGPDHQEVAIEADNLAQVLHKLGKLREAADLTRRALKIERSQSGPFHPRVAVRTGNLARILRDTGDLSGSMQHMREALEIEEKVYGSDHPRIAAICDELSSVLHTSGDPSAALVYAQRALDIDTKSFGPEHEQVAIDENNLALLYLDVGRPVDAVAHLHTSLAILGKRSGPDNQLFQHVTETLRSLEGNGMELQNAVR